MSLKTIDKDVRETFSMSLKLARRIFGIDQAEAAKRMGISTRQVGELERQSVSVKAFHVIALFKELHVAPEISMGLAQDGPPTVEDVIQSISNLTSENDMKDQVFWQDFLDAVAIKQKPDTAATSENAAIQP